MSRDVSSIAATGAALVLIVLLVASAAAAGWLVRARRGERGFVAWFGGFATVSLILAVTLLRDGRTGWAGLRGLGRWSADGWQGLSDDPFGSDQFLLNLLLFVPAGLVWTGITRRPLGVLSALVAGSLLVECVQGVTGVGAPDVADLAANGLGAALGVGVAVLVDRAARARWSGWSPRRRRTAGAFALVLAILTGAAWILGASHRQRSVADELGQRFEDTTKDDVDAWLSSATGDAEANVFSAISVRADGVRTTDRVTEVRYPATFFSLHRCVFVVWTTTSVTFRKASGGECTSLLG